MKVHTIFKLIVAFVVIIAFLPLATNAAETPSVQVVASKGNPAVGEDVTFSVNLKNFNAPSNNLSSFEVKLNFDPSYWDTVSNSVDFGPYIQSLQAHQYEMPVNLINSTGTVHMGLSMYKNDNTTYFSGDGTLFSFKLKAKKNGVNTVSVAKSLFVQISKPGVNITHEQQAASLNIGGETPPTLPPIDPGTGGGEPDPGNSGETPVTPGEVDRTQTPMENGGIKETIGFSGEKAKNTIDQAVKNKSKAIEIQATSSTSKEADYIVFSTSQETVSQLANSNLSLVITSEKGKMEMSPETLKGVNGPLTIDIFLLTDESEVENTKKRISENVKNGSAVGQSTEIKTNFSGRSKVILPLSSNTLPTDPIELEKYLKTLGVFIQHSDGKVEYLKGEIQYDKDGKPIAISVWVDRFSTFTVIKESYEKQTYVDEGDISPYAFDAVYKAQELGIMSGLNSEPKFGPSQSLTRAQFTKIILNMLGEKPVVNSSNTFKDVPKESWAYGYIMKAVELGIIKGVTPDTFKPGATITREQVALMLGRAYKMKATKAPVVFKDQAKINKEALPFVQALQEKGIIMGSQGMFQPKQTVTREMAAVIAVRTIEAYK